MAPAALSLNDVAGGDTGRDAQAVMRRCVSVRSPTFGGDSDNPVMYGPEPAVWQRALVGSDRLRAAAPASTIGRALPSSDSLGCHTLAADEPCSKWNATMTLATITTESLQGVRVEPEALDSVGRSGSRGMRGARRSGDASGRARGRRLDAGATADCSIWKPTNAPT
jgi:hypothetical protein